MNLKEMKEDLCFCFLYSGTLLPHLTGGFYFIFAVTKKAKPVVKTGYLIFKTNCATATAISGWLSQLNA